jgi:thiol:disulfide interchange protein DsbD
MKMWIVAAMLLAADLAWAGGGTAARGGLGGPLPAEPKVALPAAVPGSEARPPGADAPHPVTARLLADADVVAPGSTVTLGVHLTQDKDWHTYWKTPGEVGQPTQLTWKLPEGAQLGPMRSPRPERFVASDLVSFGYDKAVLHTATVTVPAGTAPGPWPISVGVDWLVCKTSCIPGHVDLSLTLSVGPAAVPSAAAPLFAHYAALVPKSPEEVAGLVFGGTLDASPVVPDEKFRWAFSLAAAPGHTLVAEAIEGGRGWPAFIPIVGPDAVIATSSAALEPDGHVAAVLEAFALGVQTVPTADRSGGLFQVLLDGKPVVVEATLPTPWAAAGTPRVASTDPVWAKLGPYQAAPAAAAIAPPGPPGPPGPPAPPSPPAASNPYGDPAALPVAAAPSWSWWEVMQALVLGVVGGLILNVMPCVLPVLMLKLYGLMEQTDLTDAGRRQAGVLYTAGILASFLLLAVGVWAARAVLGLEVGWGFQFQWPGYVAALAAVVFLFGLNLFGVFEIPAFGLERADALGSREGPLGFFFTGVFATLVATPCSAPILGAATAFAFQAPTAVLVLVFLAIGLGLAAPFLLVAWVPAFFRLLPKPGAWMETLKQALGFTLLGTTVWLVDVLGAQIGPDRLTGYLVFLLFLAAGAWLFGRFGGAAESGRTQLASLGGAAVLVSLGGGPWLDLQLDDGAACDDGPVEVAAALDYSEALPWQPFREDRLASLVGRTVFIDFTADWCVSCKVNERTVLETETVRAAFGKHGVVPLQADWTRKDDVIAAWLARYGRAGVPLYLVVPPSGVADAVALPEVITPGMVVRAVEDAAGG